MPKICFVESFAYSVLNSQTGETSTGGESVQHTLLAREFASRGWDTSMVSEDMGQQDGERFDGVQVWKTYKKSAGLRGLRFIYPRLFKTWRALSNADADVYFQSCAGLMTGVVARFAAQKRRKMIFRVAHDSDCIPGEQLINLERDRRIYEYGLRRSDLISVQSVVQSELMQKHYGLPSTVVDMAAEIPQLPAEEKRDVDVLWVNNFRSFKRPELLLEIAKRMPDVSFVMIGGEIKGYADLYRDIRNEANSIPNLNFVGAVPYSEVNSYFSRAKIFLNTSDSEGFPNSFLQAWVRGVPVVSYFDPDGLIASRDIGVAAASQDRFDDPLADLLRSERRRRDMAERARQFVIDRYSPGAIVAAYEHLLEQRFDISDLSQCKKSYS